jgi:HEAT repeat protein
LVTEATRCGVLIHVARENRDLAIECFRLLRSDRFTASTYQAQQRKTLRKKTQKDKRANMKSKDSPLALMQRLRSAENSRDRGSAANALGLLGVGDKEAIAALVETLKSDADLIVRSSAANALGLLARRGSHKFVGLFRA